MNGFGLLLSGAGEGRGAGVGRDSDGRLLLPLPSVDGAVDADGAEVEDDEFWLEDVAEGAVEGGGGCCSSG